MEENKEEVAEIKPTIENNKNQTESDNVVDIEQEKKKIQEEIITKKAAAFEVKRQVKYSLHLGIVAIVSIFLTALFSSSNLILGAGVAGLISVMYGFFMFKCIQKISYLDKTYDLKIKKK